MKTSNAELAQIIELCFDLSMDARIAPGAQKEFLAIGKRLRGSLLNLLSAQFNEGTKEVILANGLIKQLNEGLSGTTQVLKNTADFITQLGELVAILDSLLKLVGTFV